MVVDDRAGDRGDQLCRESVVFVGALPSGDDKSLPPSHNAEVAM